MSGPPLAAGTRYLSLLSFDDDWLDALRAAVPGLEVVQAPAASAEDLRLDLLAEADVVHAGPVLPDPAVAPRLRWVQLDTSGVDHLVGSPLWSSAVPVTTIGGVSPVPMAEYVLGMVLALAHRLPGALAGQRAHEWPSPEERWRRYMPRALPGSTLVVVGYGRIGREVGRLASAFGMQVIGVRRGAEPGGVPEADGIETVSTAELRRAVTGADHLVVTVPLTSQTRNLVGSAELAALAPGAFVVNVSRGGVVDEGALLAALDRGHLGGAALDVFAAEPLAADSPLWDRPDVIITPHVAGFAPAYRTAVLDLVVDNMRRLAAGAPLANLVDRARGY